MAVILDATYNKINGKQKIEWRIKSMPHQNSLIKVKSSIDKIYSNFYLYEHFIIAQFPLAQ